MRTTPHIVPANSFLDIAAKGNYVQVRQSAIDLIIENPQTGEKVEGSQGDDFEMSPFKSLIVYNNSGVDQPIKLTVSTNKKAGSAKVSGNVTFTNNAFLQGRYSVSNVNVLLLAANSSRRYLLIQNNDTAAVLRVTIDGNPATAAEGFRLLPGDSIEFPTVAPSGAVNVMMETASAIVDNVEFAEG